MDDMPRFYFQLHECGTVTEDDEGQEHASLSEALAAANTEARAIISAEVLQGQLCLGCCIILLDEDRAQVAEVQFRDAVRVNGLPARLDPGGGR